MVLANSAGSATHLEEWAFLRQTFSSWKGGNRHRRSNRDKELELIVGRRTPKRGEAGTVQTFGWPPVGTVGGDRQLQGRFGYDEATRRAEEWGSTFGSRRGSCEPPRHHNVDGFPKLGSSSLLGSLGANGNPVTDCKVDDRTTEEVGASLTGVNEDPTRRWELHRKDQPGHTTTAPKVDHERVVVQRRSRQRDGAGEPTGVMNMALDWSGSKESKRSGLFQYPLHLVHRSHLVHLSDLNHLRDRNSKT